VSANENKGMNGRGGLTLAIGALAVLAAGGWWWQRQMTAQLREQIAWQRDEARELARLQTENRRAAAARGSTAELENLRVEHAALVRLREEIATLRERAAMAKAAAAAMVPAGTWKNAGRATPVAAAETLLWAAAAGNLDLVAGAIAIGPTARARAEKMLAEQPATRRMPGAAAEKLMAALVMADAAEVTAMRVLAQEEIDGDALVRVRLEIAGSRVKEQGFRFRQQGDGWRLWVE